MRHCKTGDSAYSPLLFLRWFEARFLLLVNLSLGKYLVAFACPALFVC